MYEVRFVNAPKNRALTFKTAESVVVEDLERALAFASMIGKISTPDVVFGQIIVQPVNC